MAGARGIEPRSTVLETAILAVVLCPFKSTGLVYQKMRFFARGRVIVASAALPCYHKRNEHNI